MSSRQIRKLQQQRELEQAKLREQEGSEEDDEDYQPPRKAGLFSSFAALQDDENDDEEAEEETTTAKIQEKEAPLDSDEEPSVAAPKKAKKSKKKKKKAKAQDQTAARKPEVKDDADDIDAALRELNLKAQKSGMEVAAERPKLDPEYERVCALLGINNQHLKVANEMRNLFGRTAVESHDDAGGPVPRGGRRRQRAAQQQIDLETALKGHHAPGKGLPELTLRRNIFIQGKDDWPRATTGGLTMEVIDDIQAIDGTVEFRFVHDQAYEAVQQQFRIFVEMGEPQNLIGLLQRNPYHVSLLLQVSKIAKDQSDHSLSNDLVERALFTFARSSTSLFATKLLQGKARLDFARPENRELWLAGYQYIKSLMMKGTYRTAFEWAKLLLCLDPEDDPYCMHLVLHHLALRAHKFEWLLDYSTSTLFNHQLGFLEHLLTPSVALAHMHLKHGAECRKVLGDAIKKLPYIFGKLFKELNLGDVPASIWGILPSNNAEELFSEIYVRQTKDLWNTPEATGLLMEVAYAVGKSDQANIVSIDYTSITLNVARYVYLDNTPALMALVPSSLLHRIPNSDSDPLPPDVQYNLFSWPSQRAPFEQDQHGRGVAEAFAGHFDPIGALRALIPGWTGNGGEEDEEAIERTGLRELMEQDIERTFGEEGAESVGSEQEDAEPQESISNVRRLYQFLFGRRLITPPDEEDVISGAGDTEGEHTPSEGDARHDEDRP